MSVSRSPYPRPRRVQAAARPGGGARRVSRFRLVAGAAALVFGGWLSGRVRRVVVEGDSMLPSLAEGDRLVVVRSRSARVGDIVALRDPADSARLLVKRVVVVRASGLEVRGDNQAMSRDSRAFGVVAPSQVIGRAVYRYFPASRVGALRQPPASSGTLDPDGLASEGHRSAARA